MGIVREAVKSVLREAKGPIGLATLVKEARKVGGYRNAWPKYVRRYAEDEGWVMNGPTKVLYPADAIIEPVKPIEDNGGDESPPEQTLNVEIVIQGRLTPSQLAALRDLFA